MLSDRHCQAQYFDKIDVITATNDGNGAKKTNEEVLDTIATIMGGAKKIVFFIHVLLTFLGNGAMYNKSTAYLTRQVHFSTNDYNLLPSQNVMPNHVSYVRVRVRTREPPDKEHHHPLPPVTLSEGGARNYDSRRYPHQGEVGPQYRHGQCV